MVNQVYILSFRISPIGINTFVIGSFELDFGCEKPINRLELINSRNAKDRSTEGFVFSTKMQEPDPWTSIVESKLPDRRQTNDPVPLNFFFFNQVNARLVKFEVMSFYGRGGGLQYFGTDFNPGVFLFKAKGVKDIIIRLVPAPEEDGLQVTIGGWGNTLSKMKECEDCPYVQDVKVV